jgi:hypothetical protein
MTLYKYTVCVFLVSWKSKYSLRFHVIVADMYLQTAWLSLYFDVAVGLVWSNDPESYAGGSIPTGRATHAGQIEGDDPD